MAVLPSMVHLTSHPNCLRSHGPSVYKDENKHTWLHLVMDIGSDLQVWLCQVDYPIEYNGLHNSPLTSSTMPSMWTLQHDSQYVDSMGRFWRIVHHVLKDDMEEMILEVVDDS